MSVGELSARLLYIRYQAVVATEQGRLLAPLASSGHPRQTYLPRPGITPARDLPASKKHTSAQLLAWLSSVLRLPPIVQRSVPSMSSQNNAGARAATTKPCLFHGIAGN